MTNTKDGWNPIVFPIIFVLLLHQPVALYLYYHRRYKAPICNLMPWNTVMANIGTIIFSLSLCIQTTFQGSYPTAAAILVTQTGMHLGADAFLVMAFSLFIVFNRAVGLANLGISGKAWKEGRAGELDDCHQQLR